MVQQSSDAKDSLTVPKDTPTKIVPTLEPKTKTQPESKVNELTIVPDMLDWVTVAKEAGITSDEELLALDDEKILQMLTKMLNRKNFIKKIHQMRQERTKK